MPSISFKDNEDAADKAAEALEVTTGSPVVAPKQEVAALPSEGITGLDGEITSGDIKLPRLNLVQKTSEAVDAGFRPGDILFKSGDAIIPLALPSEVVVLNLRKQYQEDVPYGSDIKPRVVDTSAELRALGGSTEWGAENKWNEIAHVQVLFAAPDDTPEDLLELFPYEFEGKSYARAMMTLAKSSFTKGAKPIITAFSSHLRGRHWTGKWKLESKKQTGGGNTWYTPSFVANGRVSDEFAEFAKSFLI